MNAKPAPDPRPITEEYRQKHNPLKYRDTKCTKVMLCLDVAIMNKWAGFTCASCALAPEGLLKTPDYSICAFCGSKTEITDSVTLNFCSIEHKKAFNKKQQRKKLKTYRAKLARIGMAYNCAACGKLMGKRRANKQLTCSASCKKKIRLLQLENKNKIAQRLKKETGIEQDIEVNLDLLLF